ESPGTPIANTKTNAKRLPEPARFVESMAQAAKTRGKGCMGDGMTRGLRNRNMMLEDGAPGETRTPDPLLRRQTLYPAELRAHKFILRDLRLAKPYFVYVEARDQPA